MLGLSFILSFYENAWIITSFIILSTQIEILIIEFLKQKNEALKNNSNK